MSEFVKDSNFLALVPDAFRHTNDECPMTMDIFISLMRQFYDLKWMQGSGGAIGCISGTNLIISPSALQKERIQKQDLFVYDIEKKIEIQRPLNKKISVSSCAVLFSLLMNETGSECVIHTHSKSANLLTQLIKKDTFEISHQEYIKGIYNPFSGSALKYNDTLIIPIIENEMSESLLLNPLEGVLANYPQAVAVLVRNHGLFVWGPTWESAKIMVECIDYLLELSIDMIRNNIPLVKEDATKESGNNVDYLETVFGQ